MTIKQAIQSMLPETEIDDNNFDKVTTDRSVTLNNTYSSSDKKNTELCVADICIIVATDPDYKSGTRNIIKARQALFSLADKLYKNHNEIPQSDKLIDGAARW